MENLPFKTPSFEKAWNDWLEYRKQRKLPKYVPKGLEKTFTALARISNNDEKIAILIIEQSMEMGWQGLFPLKNLTNGSARIKVNPGKPIPTVQPEGSFGKL